MTTQAGIVEILSKYIQFHNPSAETENLAAYCPFHKHGAETTPSFYIYTGRGTATRQTGASFCHTCNEGWSLLGLLKKLRVDRLLIEAIQKEIDVSSRDTRSRIDRYYDLFDKPQMVLPESVLGVYDFVPKSLLEAGFSEELLRAYDIGFDRRTKRVTFAIRNHHGELVGISGRATREWDFPRYKIYKEELRKHFPGYELDKSKIAWGLDKFYYTRLNTAVDVPLVVCEGCKAALWVVQSGYPHTVAVIGAHLSEMQEVLLTRVTNDLVLFLDHDLAGRKSTLKLLCSKRRLKSVNLSLANYDTYEQLSPDDLSVDAVRKAIEFSITPNEWRRRYGNIL